jgi:hypothetical protein
MLGRVVGAVSAGYVVCRATHHVGVVGCQEHDNRRYCLRFDPRNAERGFFNQLLLGVRFKLRSRFFSTSGGAVRMRGNSVRKNRPGFQKGSDLRILRAAVHFGWNRFGIIDGHAFTPV